jgi:hypothetical protein
MKNYLNLLKILKKNTHSGYTLIELIITSVLTLMVVSAAGYGVYVMTRQNMIATAGGDMKYNLGRAVDFISGEVKSSATITADSSLSTTLNSLCSGQTGTTPVLGLSVNGSSTINVVYYMKQPEATWLGKNAIYRCGPLLNSSGAYTGSTDFDLLVDLIASGKDSKDPGTCGNGGTPYPNNTSGFFVCKSGNLAELHIAGDNLNSQTSKNSLAKDTNNATYGVVSQAYTRASDGVAITAAGVFAESARAILQNTSSPASNCSSNIAIKTGGSSGTPTLTTETWSNPGTTTGFTTAGILYPSINSPLSITGFTLSNAISNQITATNGSCTVLVTLRRG